MVDQKEMKIYQKKLLTTYVKEHGLTKIHVESFNHFVNVQMKKIATEGFDSTLSSENGKVTIKYRNIYLGDCYIGVFGNKQTLQTPYLCRSANRTYEVPIYIDYDYSVNNKRRRVEKQQIGKMPIMVKSQVCALSGKEEDELMALDECPLDSGGYFIINGIEKVIMIQEQLTGNRIIVSDDGKGCLTASVISMTDTTKTKLSLIRHRECFYLVHNNFTDKIPIITAIKAICDITDDQIIDLLCQDHPQLIDLICTSFEESSNHKIKDIECARNYLLAKSKSSLNSVEDIFKPILCHLEVETDVVNDRLWRDKQIVLIIMLKRLLLAYTDKNWIDDVDFVGNKRYDLPGDMLSYLFEGTFRHFNANVQKSINKRIQQIEKAKNLTMDDFVLGEIMGSQSSIIGERMTKALSSGNWAVGHLRMNKVGVSETLNRFNVVSAWGHLFRIQSQFEKTRKVRGPRALHPSHWGYLCPIDTPEGETCGIIKSLAISTMVSTNAPNIRSLVEEYTQPLTVDIMLDTRRFTKDKYIVFLDGKLCGFCNDNESLINRIRNLRRENPEYKFLSVQSNAIHGAIYIASTSGRLCRPLFIVNDGEVSIMEHLENSGDQPEIHMQNLLSEKYIEFIDCNEQNDTLIAKKLDDATLEKATHYELCDFAILGVIAGTVPFSHHNQSPRNTYQCAMGRQAIGFNSLGVEKRMEKHSYRMNYPQRPLVATTSLDLLGFLTIPAGQNAIVAVMSFSGYDLEDALMMNKASLDRGFGRNKLYHKLEYTSANIRKKVGADPEVVDKDYILPIGSTIAPHGLVAFQEGNKVTFKNTSPGHIDQVSISPTADQHILTRINIVQSRRPELGDKFSSRHGQKGVVGFIFPQEDMPFNEDGISPDIIMNPHGFPSRMTIGKMIELLSGKATVVNGAFHDATPFVESPFDAVTSTLIDAGYSYSGKETLTSGITGEPLESYIFFGPVYYQKLKHMVADKIHARSTGRVTSLTRQPVEGRAKGGGQRIGEMERDALVGHGVSQTLVERLLISSDPYHASICRKCGMLIAVTTFCNFCKLDDPEIEQVILPYACKLLISELMSMNIVLRLS